MTTVEDLRPFWVFDRLSTEQRSVIAAIAHDVEVPAGTRLFEEGQAAGEFRVRQQADGTPQTQLIQPSVKRNNTAAASHRCW